MEKKNTVLLTVIAVATLLVAVVGATFAYFTATSTAGGAGETTTTTTGKVAGATLTLGTVAGDSSKMNYPGGVGYAGASVVAAAAEGDTNVYNLSYKLKLTYENTTGTTLNYYIYDVDTIAATTCNYHEDTVSVPGKTIYYYSQEEAAGTTRTDCSVTLDKSTAIASGTLATTTEATTIEFQNNGANFVTKTGDPANTYFVVVEYPNGDDQSETDMGKKISASISGATTPVQTVYTAPTGD